ncbi:hypothetical protein M409DRAFT_28395 [Zasmidium cellare ATCC 36951]|uniref:Sulfotransferase domain-containing protein n=1 Tax=Zasmidium cellare ATCC 36951 TaxID=1080233 RepID=A0A6A6C259_ZASCE|nr:uncharacterized protein M409DRAFT_28395 [Zasmidium cellare ATCC 36951]KAF2161065.1 hypothetical protein M409DRAFT_28395 [Zasmidium cellare ATCC 36951]
MEQESRLPKRHVLIFDHPRSCSNLLGKLLETHPDVTRLHRPWRDARTRVADRTGLSFTPETAVRFQKRRLGAEQPDFSHLTVAKANEHVAESIRAAREKNTPPSSSLTKPSTALCTTCNVKGNLAIIQEHTAILITDEAIHGTLHDSSSLPNPSANTTIIRSDILQTSIPLLLIRHPALAIPSFLRMHLLEEMLVPEDEMFRYWISYRWLRIIYSHLASLARENSANDLAEPVIIDAYDIVQKTPAVMARLCELFHIGQGEIRETWEVGEGVVGEPNELDVRWVETLWGSRGVIRREDGVVDWEIRVGELVEGWGREFGGDRGEVLKGMVEGEMEDYGFLWERRVRF